MDRTDKFCILFAGAVGSSKTPIAHYVSIGLGLPILNNDVIRTEVLEDVGEFDKKEYDSRVDARVKQALAEERSFIYDASIDRSWESLRELFAKNNYSWCVISLDLSKDFLADLYRTKGYLESLERIDGLVGDHHKFVEMFGFDIAGSINETDFPNRLEKGLEIAKGWLQERP